MGKTDQAFRSERAPEKRGSYVPNSALRGSQAPIGHSDLDQHFRMGRFAEEHYSHRYVVYHFLVDKLGKASEFKPVEAMLARMKEEGVVFREDTFISFSPT